MCQVCYQYPCDPRCPNAPEEEVFAECAECGCEIHDGDEYFEIDGKCYCESCIEDKRRYAEV